MMARPALWTDLVRRSSAAGNDAVVGRLNATLAAISAYVLAQLQRVAAWKRWRRKLLNSRSVPGASPAHLPSPPVVVGKLTN